MINFFKTLIFISFVTALISCSNTTPVSVNNEKNIKTAELYDISLRDISVAGPDHAYLWALTTYLAPTNSDYYLYKYDQMSGSWTPTGHYGVLISSCSNGRCYHINSSNQIWWATLTSNGQITNRSTITQFTDISASLSGGALYLYVIGTNSYNQKQLWKYVSSPGGAGWSRLTFLAEGAMSPIHISADPKDGRKLFLTTTGVTQVSTNAGSSWSYENNMIDHNLAAWCDGNVIVRRNPDNLPAFRKADGTFRFSCCQTTIAVSTYDYWYYWVNSGNGLCWYYYY